ncbi:MAG: hypothetical protein F6K11_10770 [Leptolyngbya sp. SIO3F4]|nr:hypothetical protein [Leptolyngbya sp. SIO3F4]
MSKFVKAKLIAQGGGSNIEFMFNPTELSFTRTMNLNSCGGARTESGIPKVSFGSAKAETLELKGLVFDTYETGENVINKHIQSFQKAVEFLDNEERPPMYIFAWGKQEYLRCFVQSLTYTLTMFLPDGTPVRATVDITLQEIDDMGGSGNTGTPSRS